MEIMPMLGCADHVISDPPYEDELHVSADEERITRYDGHRMVGALRFNGVNDKRKEIAEKCVNISNGWLILFTLAEGVRAWRDDIQSHGGKWDTTCFWIKPDASPRFNGQGPARGAECFVTAWCGSGYRSWNGGGRRGVFTHPCNPPNRGECVDILRGEKPHPTEKPIALMMELASLFTNPGQIVLDPFMGSGTTGVACHKLGRKFIGIEKNEKYFDIAVKRMTMAARQDDLFIAPVKPLQEKIAWPK